MVLIRVSPRWSNVMTDEIKNPNNQVGRSANGRFHAFRHGYVVYDDNGRVKEFETERDAWDYLGNRVAQRHGP
jgi:hypothetical protein